MRSAEHNPSLKPLDGRVTVEVEANFGTPSGGVEAMARRRFQAPRPEKLGRFWYIRVWQDEFRAGVRTRKRKRIKLAPATKGMREVKKLAAEHLRPLNQGLIGVGAGVNFMKYVDNEYRPKYLPDLAKPVQNCYESVLKVHLESEFGSACLADLTRPTLKGYFANRARGVEYPTLLKIRDTLSSILRAAVDGEFLLKSPLDGLRLPKDRRPRRSKPVLTPQQFSNLTDLIPEPYATMVFVCVLAGLRVSEGIGLRWRDVKPGAIVVSERYCRGDWSCPKTPESGSPIAVEQEVIERIEQLKKLTVTIRAGRAIRKYAVVKSCGPNDLVFQSVKEGKPMRDGNILSRFIKPAARKLGLDFVNWLVLRRSCATWLIESGADVKAAQGQMRHTRPATTLGIYAQVVPTAQRRVSQRLSEFIKEQSAGKFVATLQ